MLLWQRTRKTTKSIIAVRGRKPRTVIVRMTEAVITAITADSEIKRDKKPFGPRNHIKKEILS